MNNCSKVQREREMHKSKVQNVKLKNVKQIFEFLFKYPVSFSSLLVVCRITK